VDRGVGDEVRALASNNGAADAVHLLGSVSEDTLRVLYRDAHALVYPSLYEGFGLPLLEAMACGTPVLASKAASIPEVVGDAGVLLDSHDPAAWAEAIVRLAVEPGARHALRARGLLHAAGWSWGRTARETLAAYRRVARGPRPA
jgi:glycosyltransferase involved in cell wall biosynthesis